MRTEQAWTLTHYKTLFGTNQVVIAQWLARQLATEAVRVQIF